MVDKRLLLVDTSTNGTFVNGKRVGRNETIELSHGDTISLLVPTTAERDTEYGRDIPVSTPLAFGSTHGCT